MDTIKYGKKNGFVEYTPAREKLFAAQTPQIFDINIYKSAMERAFRELSDWTDEGAIADYLRKILRKEAGDGSGLIYGLGHAVYTLSDPRAQLLKEKAKELAQSKDRMEEFYLYDAIERLGPAIFNEDF